MDRRWAGVTAPILAGLADAFAAGDPVVDVAALAGAVGVSTEQVVAELGALRDSTCVEFVDAGAGRVRVARLGPLALQLLGREPSLVPQVRSLQADWAAWPRRVRGQ